MNAISKNVYIDKIGDIINKHNNMYHRTINIKPIDVRSSTLLTLILKIMIMALNLKLVFM